MLTRGTITKLQYALKSYNFIVTVPMNQIYHTVNEKFIKIYKVVHNKRTIYSSTSITYCIKYLAELLKVVREYDVNFKDRDNIILNRMEELQLCQT